MNAIGENLHADPRKRSSNTLLQDGFHRPLVELKQEDVPNAWLSLLNATSKREVKRLATVGGDGG